MKVTSPAFENNGFIPEKYTQEGENISPPLVISEIPKAAKSLALLAVDPDAPDPEHPKLTFTHWIVYNLPAKSIELSEGIKIQTIKEAEEGFNDRGTIGYIGPRPPIGTHRYFFKVYALNLELSFDKPPHRAQILQLMDGHVVEIAEIMGRYKLQGQIKN